MHPPPLMNIPAAAKCLASAHQDWSSLQSEFSKRFDSQLKQELADQGSSVTGEGTGWGACRALTPPC